MDRSRGSRLGLHGDICRSETEAVMCSSCGFWGLSRHKRTALRTSRRHRIQQHVSLTVPYKEDVDWNAYNGTLLERMLPANHFPAIIASVHERTSPPCLTGAVVGDRLAQCEGFG